MHGHLYVSLSWCTVTWTSIYHDARSPERQFITMHGHPNVNLSRCTVIRTSVYHDARSPERQFITIHGHPNVNISRCTVTWTSDAYDNTQGVSEKPAASMLKKSVSMNTLLLIRLSWKWMHHFFPPIRLCVSIKQHGVTSHNIVSHRCENLRRSSYYDVLNTYLGSYGSSSPLCLINCVGFINCLTQLSVVRCMLFIT